MKFDKPKGKPRAMSIGHIHIRARYFSAVAPPCATGWSLKTPISKSEDYDNQIEICCVKHPR